MRLIGVRPVSMVVSSVRTSSSHSVPSLPASAFDGVGDFTPTGRDSNSESVGVLVEVSKGGRAMGIAGERASRRLRLEPPGLTLSTPLLSVFTEVAGLVLRDIVPMDSGDSSPCSGPASLLPVAAVASSAAAAFSPLTGAAEATPGAPLFSVRWCSSSTSLKSRLRIAFVRLCTT